MTRVLDASVVVSGLVDDGPIGRWALGYLGVGFSAPHLMAVEVANILRRANLAGQISGEVASQAHTDLLDLPVTLFPYAPVAHRAWQLKANLTAYDAAYVALAETLGVPLVTLDHRLSRATGPRCAFETPPAQN